ncbi:MAG TPA: peptidylprolyl isomerase [Acidimicrobiales bacterium]|nr:peptidylprolyl isomerase [Acidimicrobiales bacterium]
MKELRLTQMARRRRQRRFLTGSGIALVIIVAVVLSATLTGGGGGKSKNANPPTTPPKGKHPTTTVSTTTVPPTPSSVPLIAAPAKVGCPSLTNEAKHYTRFSSPPPMCIDPSKQYTAHMVTDVGTITFKLLAAQNPTTVNNFVFLAGYHFYDGTIFHRVVTGFVDQGGDPLGSGQGGPGYSFNGGAPKAKGFTYHTGDLAMANSGTPASDGSQFFIVVKDLGSGLSPNYSYFGKVTSGLNVVEKINADGSATGQGIPKVVHKILHLTITES